MTPSHSSTALSRLALAAPALPDRALIARVAAMSEPVQRNLWITHIYHRLEVALAERLGDDDVSWCAYGTWASKTAGRFIRGEVVPGVLRPLVARGHVLGRLIARVDARVRERIAFGNRHVFAELAPAFRELVDLLDLPPSSRPAAAAEFLAGFAPGATEDGGQDTLRRAFAAYLAAAETRAPKPRAERILLANTLVGLHEQIRLQPAIAAALTAPTAMLVPADADPLRRALGERLGVLLRTTLTRWMMTIALPGGDVSLGHDVPATADGRSFPAALERVELPELRAVLGALDRTPDTTDGSAADDWAALDDRMNFIVDLFRSRQRDRSLRSSPFSSAQLADLHAGARPRGPL